MKHALALVAMFAAAPVVAQTAPASSPAPSDPQAATPAVGGGAKALRVTCRGEAMAKGLDGMERRQAVSACVVAKRPDLAGREQCRTNGFAKGLRKQELHAFVRECARAKG